MAPYIEIMTKKQTKIGHVVKDSELGMGSRCSLNYVVDTYLIIALMSLKLKLSTYQWSNFIERRFSNKSILQSSEGGASAKVISDFTV